MTEKNRQLNNFGQTYRTDWLRTIWTSKKRFLSLIIMTMLGALVFIGLITTAPNMRKNLETSIRGSKRDNIEVTSYFGLDSEDKKLLEGLPDLASIDYFYRADFYLDGGDKPVRLNSLPENSSLPLVKEGRLPQNDREILMDLEAKKDGMKLGQEIRLVDNEKADKESKKLKSDKTDDFDIEKPDIKSPLPSKKLKNEIFKVVGFAESISYLSTENRGRTELGDGKIDYFAYALKSVFEADKPMGAMLKFHSLENLNTYDKEYRDRENTLISKLEEVLSKRPKQLEKDIKSDLAKSIDEGKSAIEKGYADLKKARTDLEDAKKALSDGEKDYKKGKKDYEDGLVKGRKKLDDAQKSLDKAFDKLEKGRDGYDEGLKKYQDGLKDLNDKKSEIDDGAAELKDGQDKLDEAKKKLSDQGVNRSYLESNKSKVLSGLSQIDEGLAKINKAIEDRPKNLALIKSERDKLLAMKAELEGQKAQAQEGLKQVNAGIDEINKNLDALKNLPALKATLEDLKNQLTQLKAQLDQLKADPQGNATQIAQLEAQIAGLEGQIANIQDQVSKLEMLKNQEGQLRAKLAQLEAEKAKIEAGIGQIDRGLSQINDGLKKLQASEDQLLGLDGQKSDLEGKRSQAQSGLRQIEEGLAGLDKLESEEEKLNKAKKDFDEGLFKYNDGRAKLDKAKKDLDDAKKKLDDGFSEYNKGKKDLSQGIKDYDSGKLKGLKKLNEAWADLKKGRADYEDGLKKYEEKAPQAEIDLADGQRDLDKAEKDLEELEVPEYSVKGRYGDNLLYAYIDGANNMDAMTLIFPVVFYLIAMLITMTTTSRMVEEERGQIGTMKALGYNKNFIASKYLVYSGLAATIGTGLGIVVGYKMLMPIIVKAYSFGINLLYPLSFSISPLHILIALLIGLGLTLLTAAYSSSNTLRQRAARLMKAKPPKKGNRIFLERIKPVWKRMGFMRKITMRNITVKKSRMFMTILGVMGCSSLIIMGFGLKSSISNMLYKQFHVLDSYDVSIVYDNKADAEDISDLKKLLHSKKISSAPYYAQLASFINADGNQETVSIMVPFDEEAFENLRLIRERKSRKELTIPKDGALASERLYMSLKDSDGALTVKDLIGHKYDLKIVKKIENYIGNLIIMSPENYEKYFDKKIEENALLVKFEDMEDWKDIKDEVRDNPAVQTSQEMTDTLENVNRLMASLDIIVVVIILISSALAFVVLFNLTNLNVSERKRELSTIKVLGFTDKEVTEYIYRETFILTLIGIIFGLACGKGIHYMICMVLSPQGILIDPHLVLSAFLIGSAITMVFSIIVMLIIHRQLKEVDMVEALKADE